MIKEKYDASPYSHSHRDGALIHNHTYNWSETSSGELKMANHDHMTA